MSGREQALPQSVEEMNRLIAELHDLRRRVQRAEAIARAGRHVAPGTSGGAVVDFTRWAVAVRSSRAVGAR
jgi:hypothetical protein